MTVRTEQFWDIFYMSMAEKVAELSRDIKTKVGCVIVKDDNVVSFSYNGTPRGSDNVMRDDYGRTLPIVLHAESNAIGKAAQLGTSTRMGKIYTTLSPCINCAKIIHQSGITHVVYRDLHEEEPLAFLRSVGVEVRRVDGSTTSSSDCNDGCSVHLPVGFERAFRTGS